MATVVVAATTTMAIVAATATPIATAAKARTVTTIVEVVIVVLVGIGGGAISKRLCGHQSLRLGGYNNGGEKGSFIGVLYISCARGLITEDEITGLDDCGKTRKNW
jgi:hypothetical protein